MTSPPRPRVLSTAASHTGHPLMGLSLLLGASLLSFAALAQPAGSEHDDFIHRVRPNDTLSELAATYLLDIAQWHRIAEYNQVQVAQRLPTGKLLRIPLDWIPRQPVTAVLEYVRGNVTVDGQPAQAGQAINAGQRLRTASDGAAAIRLPDGGFLSLPENSQANVETLQQFAGTGLLDAVIDLEAGDLETEVAPQHQGVGRFEVRTPVTVTGVRGTHFRVRFNESGSVNEVLDGEVQLAVGTDKGSDSRPVAAGQGTRVGRDGLTYPIVALPETPSIIGAEQYGDGWRIDFTAVPGAASYLAQYSQDEAGTKIISRQRLATPPLEMSLRDKHYFVRLFAIDAQGLRSLPSRAVALTGGQPSLKSSDGNPVMTGTGEAVQLQSF